MGDSLGAFEIKSVLGVDPPCYVRKVDSRGNWGAPEDEPSERLNTAMTKVFGDEWESFSIYEVADPADLSRVAVGMNSRRDSLIEKIFLLGFEKSELGHLSVVETPGDTKCAHANDCHREVRPGDPDALEAVVSTMMEDGRNVGTLTKGMMRDAVAAAETDGCAATGAAECVCTAK